MQNNGFKILLTVAFIALCGYYLYPSVQNLVISQQLSSMDEVERERYEEENYARLQNIRESSLKLGLDLLGGMHVTLEVRVPALIDALADDQDEMFSDVLSATRDAFRDGEDAVSFFVEEFERQDPNVRLSRYFRSEEHGIDRRSENSEVESYLNDQTEEAVERAMEIIRNRVDRFGVSEPSIQRQGERRVIVELPGVDDQERVRGLLEGTARLEFRLMADPQQLSESVERIIEYFETAELDDLPEEETPDEEEEIAEGEDPATLAEEAQPLEGEGEQAQDLEPAPEMQEERDNPLLQVMQPMPHQRSVIFGRVFENDTSRVNELLNRPEVQDLLPPGIELMYGANPVGRDEQGQPAFDLLAVREDVELAGDRITDATVDFDQHTNEPRVSMTMDSEGARIWGRVTGANVGNHVAIALDGVIYSYPTVEERILGGRSSISGLQSRQEAQDIVNVLKSGALPAPVDIVEERTVGPSLGQASIRAGFISVVAGLLLVALFMIFYYHTAGVIADIALLLNVIFILGILAGFGATLTLPGIAGIVLTIGMAVDANVLIFDRIREEMNTGKTLKAAIDAGYKQALSAIFDANITTFFVGAILYSFGVGPIQGFAVTLMAGILSSLFTAIIVTRIVTDYLLEERRSLVSYG